MTNQDKLDLRAWRDSCQNDDDKRLLRATLTHIEKLESRQRECVTLLRAAMRAVGDA